MIVTKEVEKKVPKLIKMGDAARLLGVKYPTLRAYVLRHRLPIERIPMEASVYIRVEDVERLQEARSKLNGV